MRLQKYIAAAGVTSRRKAENMILQGRVAVNGMIVTALGTKVDPERDQVEVDGKPVSMKADKVYYLFYKPEKVITSVSDPQGRPVVTDFFPSKPRLFPVGRLDYMTSGLLILTNDGEFMNYMIHPRHEVDKAYQVLVQGHPDREKFKKLENGIDLDGRKTKSALVKNIVTNGNDCEFTLTIQEGRNRQVRKMCQAIGHPVIRLKRVRMGPLTLKGLQPGQYRPLSQKELNQIFQRRP